MAGSFALWLTLGAACSTLLADQMRRLRYSVVLRTPYESRRLARQDAFADHDAM